MNIEKKQYPGVFGWGLEAGYRPTNILVLVHTFNGSEKSWGWNNNFLLVGNGQLCFDTHSGYPVPYAPQMLRDIDWDSVPIAGVDYEPTFTYAENQVSAFSAKSEES